MKRKELISQIRFQLEQLSAKNEAMIFEHLARHFSRARIHKNFIPATGPVQSGGDQGRDFETFHSYLSQSEIADSVFLGDFSNSPVIGACSLQKEPIKSNKIKKDVQTIMGSGTKVERIYFFSSQDIPVSSRHKLIDEIKIQHKVELEIIDAQALSEQLLDKDLFWIAHEYLNIPIEYYPKEVLHSEYSTLKSEFENYVIKTFSIETFVKVVNALRYIYKDSELVHDIPFWLNHLEFFIQFNDNRRTQRNAIYEKVIVNIISKNDVQDLPNSFNSYFSDLAQFSSVQELEKAINFLSLSISTKELLNHDITKHELQKIQNSISSIVEERIKSSTDPNTIVSFLSIKAISELTILSRNESIEKRIELFSRVIEDLLVKLPEANLYPITHLCTFINKQIDLMLEIGVETNTLEKIASKVEVYALKKEIDFNDAENKRNRAVSFLKHNKPHKAIKTLHTVKNQWFNEETLQGSILSSMIIAKTYQSLGLCYAAKYYALAGGSLVITSGKDDLLKYLPESLSIIASIDYALGNWINFLEVIDLSIPVLHTVRKDFDIYEDEGTFSILYHTSVIKYINGRFNLGLDHYLNHKTSQWGYLNDEIKVLDIEFKETFDKLEERELVDTFEKQLMGTPFNDLGKENQILFNMYAIDFQIDYFNDFKTVCIAEQFTAILQIILADLEDIDLHNLKIPVIIKIKVCDGELNYEQVPSNENSIWSISIPLNFSKSTKDIYNSQSKYLEFVIALLLDLSLLENEKLLKILNTKLAEENLTSKTTFVNSYEYLFRQFYCDKSFEMSYREKFTNTTLNSSVSIKPNDYYQWNSGVSQYFNESEILHNIDNRLSHKKTLHITLEKLKSKPEFITTVHKLRNEKHLDWQIFLAVLNLGMNFKINITSMPKSADEIKHAFQNYLKINEADSYIEIPDNTFDYIQIKNNLDTVVLSTVLPSYGLQQRDGNPYFKKIRELLDNKFKYHEIGIEKQII